VRLTWRYGEEPETQHDGSACAVSYFSFSSIGQFCILTPRSVAVYAVFGLW